MVEPLRIAIAGLGTVGAGVVKLIQQNGDLIAARAGRPIEIFAISARDRKKDRGVNLSKYKWIDDTDALATLPVDAVVELIGGAEGSALSLAEKALAAGKSLVTANKAMLAHHGAKLAAMAEGAGGGSLYFEAAVAGGIPVIKALREGFAANRIRAVYGILNGTCNFILTEMRETGRDFADVLQDAQKNGYAEADPSFDIDGIDAAHKLSILTALSFGITPEMGTLSASGIRHVSASDIAYAGELGYKIKLLGVARKLEDGGIVQAVEPCLVPASSALGAVEGVYNAVYIEGDFAGAGLSTGRGAGAGPTASAVVADLIDLARGHDNVPTFGIPIAQIQKQKPLWGKTAGIIARHYMHLVVRDVPGVLADVTAILRDRNVSVESMIQRGRDPKNPVSIVMTLHHARQEDVRAAATDIEALGSVIGTPSLLRIEDF